MTSTFQRLAIAAGALLLAGAGIVTLDTSPADAATPSFYGTNAPLEWNSTVYNGPAVLRDRHRRARTSEITAPTPGSTRSPVSASSGFTGHHQRPRSTRHLRLRKRHTERCTIFVSDQVLQDGSYPATCAGIDAALFGGATACDAIVPNMLTSNGAADRLQRQRHRRRSSTPPTTPRPSTTTGDITPNIVWPNYQGSGLAVHLRRHATSTRTPSVVPGRDPAGSPPGLLAALRHRPADRSAGLPRRGPGWRDRAHSHRPPRRHGSEGDHGHRRRACSTPRPHEPVPGRLSRLGGLPHGGQRPGHRPASRSVPTCGHPPTRWVRPTRVSPTGRPAGPTRTTHPSIPPTRRRSSTDSTSPR